MPTLVQTVLLPLAPFAVGCGSACLAPWYADADGDGYGDPGDLIEACHAPKGYVDDASDCDDRDAAIHPGQTDSCNEVDDDCDGAVDPEAREWFADIDSDGVGGEYSSWSCAAPAGHVDRPGDCDDGNPKVYPTALEQCDGLDQDCDELVDEGAPGEIWWYPDEDFDGWGDYDGGRRLCAPPEGWVTLPGDCDDTTPYRQPGALEVCNEVDDDCDQAIDEDDPEGAAGTLWVYVDADSDGVGAGLPLLYCPPVVPPYSVSGADCDDSDPAVYPGGLEVCGGGDEDCDTFVDAADPSVDPTTEVPGWADVDQDGLGDPAFPTTVCALGGAVVGNELDCDDHDPRVATDDWLPDLDGDGAGAGTIAAGEDCEPPAAGMVNVGGFADCDDGDPTIREHAPDFCGDGVDQDCSGIDPACTPALAGIVPIGDLARAWVDGQSLGDELGVVGPGADFDGDGFVDLVVGAPGADAVRIVAGPPPEGAAPWAVEREVVGYTTGSRFGAAVTAVGDLTSDGLPDLLVGAPEENGVGGAYLFSSSDGFAAPWLQVIGQANDEVGAAVANIGDVDGVGGLEVLIGAPGRNEVAVVSVGSGVLDFGAAPLVLQGTGQTRLGSAVACCTDLPSTLDQPKLVLADPADAAAGTDAGAVWIVDARSPGGTWPVNFYSEGVYTGSPFSRLGEAVATEGDLDGDGARDLIASAPLDNGGGAGAGKIYGFTTEFTGDADSVATWAVEGDYAGMGLARSLALGDIDGDGADDVAMGTDEVAVGGADGGAVYVFFGPVVGGDEAADADAVLFGPAGTRAGASLVLTQADADLGADLWIGLPGVAPGAAWLVPGP